MKKTSYNKLLLLGATAFVATACTDKFEEYNTNTYQVTEEEMTWDNQKTGSFFAQMQRGVTLFKDGTNEYSDYQVEEGLTSDLYSGYVAATIASRNGQHTGAYYFVQGWYDQTFTKRYTQVMAPFSQLTKVAEEQNRPEIKALATVVKVMAMHRAADAYGALPYCNYGSNSLTSTYDGLQAIYTQFFSELDEAIEELQTLAASGASLMSNYDYVYGGDVSQWVKLANTLRLRLAMRVVYANAALAKTEAEKCVSSGIGFIESKNDRAVVDENHTSITYYHPLYEIAYNFNDGDCRPGASIIAYMNGYNDPRLSVYFKKADDSGEYVGVRSGVYTSTWADYRYGKVSNFNITTASAITWFTAAESWFLRAEGALRGWNMGGTAQEFYNKGIQASFEETGASGVDAYLADDTSTPGDYVDPVASNNCANTSTITIAYDESADFETNLERIITQKWIAIYPDGPEGWSEFRRTGYPKLFPVVNNASSGTVDTDIQVRRIPFPVSEYNNDAEGVQTGIAALGGADNGGTKVWWDKK